MVRETNTVTTPTGAVPSLSEQVFINYLHEVGHSRPLPPEPPSIPAKRPHPTQSWGFTKPFQSQAGSSVSTVDNTGRGMFDPWSFPPQPKPFGPPRPTNVSKGATPDSAKEKAGEPSGKHHQATTASIFEPPDESTTSLTSPRHPMSPKRKPSPTEGMSSSLMKFVKLIYVADDHHSGKEPDKGAETPIDPAVASPPIVAKDVQSLKVPCGNIPSGQGPTVEDPTEKDPSEEVPAAEVTTGGLPSSPSTAVNLIDIGDSSQTALLPSPMMPFAAKDADADADVASESSLGQYRYLDLLEDIQGSKPVSQTITVAGAGNALDDDHSHEAHPDTSGLLLSYLEDPKPDIAGLIPNLEGTIDAHPNLEGKKNLRMNAAANSAEKEAHVGEPSTQNGMKLEETAEAPQGVPTTAKAVEFSMSPATEHPTQHWQQTLDDSRFAVDPEAMMEAKESPATGSLSPKRQARSNLDSLHLETPLICLKMEG